MEIDNLIVRQTLSALRGLLKSPNNNAARVLARLAAENLEDCLPENVAKAAAEVIANESREPIPDGVFYSPPNDNFYDAATRVGMGELFYVEWFERRGEFPLEWF